VVRQGDAGDTCNVVSWLCQLCSQYSNKMRGQRDKRAAEEARPVGKLENDCLYNSVGPPR